MSELNVLLIPVVYENQGEGLAFCQWAANEPGSSEIDIAVADNSTRSDDKLAQAFETVHRCTYFSFPHNPGYAGGARLVLAHLVAERGKLPYDAVILCNTDLRFSVAELLQVVSAHRSADPEARWILAPDITEDEGLVHKNPHMHTAPHGRRRLVQRALGASYASATLYRFALRRRAGLNALTVRRPSSGTSSKRPAAGVTMFAPHGSFMILGRGYFLSGGSFPEGPLFNEEFAIGTMAELTNTRVIYAPELIVRHLGRATTGSFYSRKRYELTARAWRFYRNWRAEDAIGLMQNWFDRPSLPSD